LEFKHFSNLTQNKQEEKGMKDWEDPIVNEVREARAKIMEEAGSLENWFKLLKKEQQEHKGQAFQHNKVKMDNKQ